VMALLVFLAAPLAETWTGPEHPLWQRLLALLTLCGGGFVVFLATCVASRALDAKALGRAFRRP